MTMKRTALFLEEEQRKKLQKLSDKTGAPIAELIRRAKPVNFIPSISVGIEFLLARV